MAKNEVSVTLKAYDQTAAAFKSAEKGLDRLVRSAQKVGAVLGGVFVAGQLGKFVKESMRLAAEADAGVGKSFQNLSEQFQAAQVAIGTALLGNKGVVFALETASDALRLFAKAIESPAAAIKAVFTNLWNSTGWIIGKLAAGIGALTNNTKLQRIGEAMEDRAVIAMAGPGSISELLGPAPRGKGTAAKRDRRVESNAEYGPAGQYLTANVTQVRSFVDWDRFLPTADEIAGQLDQALGDRSQGIGRALAEMAFWTDLREAFATQVSYALVDAFTGGIEAAIASGSIGEGFKALSATLLSGLGSAMIEFGTASLLASTLMDKIKTGLMSFLPGGAIAASLAMIGIGAALKGVASRAFGGMGNRGGGVSGSLASTPDTMPREQLVVYLDRDGYARADSPEFQEFIAQVIARGASRNVVFRPA